MVSLRPEEISKLIKEQIRRYDEELEVGETGSVITIGDGIALVPVSYTHLYCPWSALDLVSTSNGVKKRYGFIYVDRTDRCV